MKTLKTSRRPKQKKYSLRWLVGISAFSLGVAALFYVISTERPAVSRAEIRRALYHSKLGNTLPATLNFTSLSRKKNLVARATYTIDRPFHESIQTILHQYAPDYAAFVAIEPKTGRILSLLSVQKPDIAIPSHLALRASFPSASIFKVITAAAVISSRKAHSDTLIAYNGRPHTLYRSHVLKADENRYTQRVSLREAFAKSINTVFGKLGVFFVGSDRLREYADRFGFDEDLVSDVPVEMGRAHVSNNSWELAETSSGFTNANTMSPLLGAVIAATVVNDGARMVPYLVDSLHTEDGEEFYKGTPELATQAIDKPTALELRELMRATVDSGTSRVSFKGFQKGRILDLDVGGKTGSLTGYDPFGKYEWFVGYGDTGEKSIAIAAMVVSRKKWKVKASYLARRALEIYFNKSLESRRAPIPTKDDPMIKRERKS